MDECLLEHIILGMEQKQEWTDITALVKEAASELEEGIFIAAPDFNYEASMRSIDITDPKIDTGINAMSIKSVTYQVAHSLEYLESTHE